MRGSVPRGSPPAFVSMVGELLLQLERPLLLRWASSACGLQVVGLGLRARRPRRSQLVGLGSGARSACAWSAASWASQGVGLAPAPRPGRRSASRASPALQGFEPCTDATPPCPRGGRGGARSRRSRSGSSSARSGVRRSAPAPRMNASRASDRRGLVREPGAPRWPSAPPPPRVSSASCCSSRHAALAAPRPRRSSRACSASSRACSAPGRGLVPPAGACSRSRARFWSLVASSYFFVYPALGAPGGRGSSRSAAGRCSPRRTPRVSRS